MKILHIEHSLLIKNASKDVIESLNHDYLGASSYKEAKGLLKHNKVDLIITALELEDIDGFEMIKNISDSEYSDTPIIVLTAYDSFEMREKLFELGVVDYQLKKNFSDVRLKSYIESIQLNEELSDVIKEMNIAVIDDSILTINIIQNIFDLNNIDHVDYFYDSTSLLENMKKYDIYIVDLVLPETTGESLINDIKLINPDSIIIMISSTSNYKTISHTLNIGADDFIVKPFDANTFLVRIKQHIKQHILLKRLEVQNAKLLRMSITDGLTNIYNHKYIMERLEEECERSERYGRNLAVVLFDLDNFKKVNDTYGHQQGDEVLKSVASTIKSVIRTSDVVGRYGGEEFLIILPDTGMKEAYSVAEKIRIAIENLAFDLQDFRVTISGGVSGYNHFNYSQMIRDADMKLYEAKRAGKNKII